MDFSRILSMDLNSSNSTLSLPSILMDALVPGYGNISQLIYRLCGIDVGYVVSGCLVLFGLFHGGQFLYNQSFDYIASYFTSSIYIEDNDNLYSQVMKWVAEQRMTKVSRDLKAVSKWVNNYQDDEDELDDDDFDVLDEKGIFNFEKWAGNIPPRYEPNYGSDRFYHDGRYFQFSREKKENKWSSDDDESLVIRCFGRSTQPIKDLLNHVKRWTLNKENKMTSVYRAPAESHGGRMWNRQSCRPSRPMHTVSLEQQQKAKIVRDINEYLHPVTARWYASRGIPYRRGYLFHGPPGTGKTSLSFALAGIFGLPVYCISLNEVGLTESDLGTLFSQLPRRCIVLLEDIDSAGLRRDDMPTGMEGTDPISPASETADGSEDGLTKISKTDVLISLSGLLNIIDGAASHEGRVLIMTTNCPENLDPALIRPGRVDLQVLFTLATREQIRDIFTRMYSTEFDAGEVRSRASSTKPTPNSSKTTNRQNDDLLALVRAESRLDTIEPEKLVEMAQQFADQLPEARFSPAEIQGYLLMRKQDPTKALAEVGKWRDEILESKRSGKKVVNVFN
ncbi:P-loop containing nucleoside triphosphate hydrolase protein [Cucurbitaria berberidis CBS 394.84]|uniref:P-loop containing nucleoside triphosphate hydrolase protein n=1 Tax=Cucurbitaria berberidis CBS 394.84 TaxID=1168544 RepID=A0A9P4GN53_9PLEO|nr:P-loop containing nucleoside triphosphate hydrolase protein [Cucurbitaria berberidis CBS 394.84]KAF1848096.1 P-loop containing nucleoside triphosphate hydrolase protein [Cucurbitaria berberidis CBS 394.84]